MNTFKPKPKSKIKLSVDHIDRDPFNNHISNLRRSTTKEQNENRSIVRKEIIKLTERDLNEAYLRTKNEILSDIAKDYNLTKIDLHRLLRYMHPLY